MNAEQSLKIVFMGTPSFALPVLSALLDAGHEVVGLYTQPDKPSGRGRGTTPSPVKAYATEHGLRVFQPASLRRPDAHEELASLSPDVIVVAAYGRILPPGTLELPPLGCLNVHPSLLPRYRGPSPVSAAVLNGDQTTGVTVMKLDEGMDTGPIVAQKETPIAPPEDAEELTARLFRIGASLLIDVLPRWARGEIRPRPQDDSDASTTKRLSREDGQIDWTLSASRIERQVRAYRPWPGTFTRWGGRLLKIIEASAPNPETKLQPGHVALSPDGSVHVGAGAGALVVARLQLEGRRAVTAEEFVRGHPDFVGSTLGE